MLDSLGLYVVLGIHCYDNVVNLSWMTKFQIKNTLTRQRLVWYVS